MCQKPCRGRGWVQGIEMDELVAAIWRAGKIYVENLSGDWQPDDPNTAESLRCLKEVLGRFGLQERSGNRGRPPSGDRVRLEAAASM